MAIARLDEETVASITEAKRSIAADHATLLRHAKDAQAAAEVHRITFRNQLSDLHVLRIPCLLLMESTVFWRTRA